jgi:hypothetical protein
LERLSVNVRWRPPLAVAIVTWLPGFGLTTWMQTTGRARGLIDIAG